MSERSNDSAGAQVCECDHSAHLHDTVDGWCAIKGCDCTKFRDTDDQDGAKRRPLDLVCGCETTCNRDDGSYEVLRVQRGSKCHAIGYVISAAEARHIRFVNAEWDRAEREWLEQQV